MKSFCQREDQHEVIARLRQVRPTDRPLWGRMYAGAMVKHLAESYAVAMKQRDVQRPAFSALRGPHGRWLAFRERTQWAKNLRTLPEVDIMLRKDYTIDFAAEHAALVELIQQFCAASAEQLRPEHPLLGRLTREQWMRWGYLHADHHLRQFSQ